MPPQIQVCPDSTALVQAALATVLERIQQAMQSHGRCALVLAGGNTPKPLYAALAQQPIDWQRLYVFWGDERYVPVDHPDSNEGMARQVWLDQVPIPTANIFGMPTAEADPAIAAQHYEDRLCRFFALEPGEFPCFDLILLGMGDDGHTASLFPYTTALGVSDRLITVGQKGDQPRLTFTVPLINHAACVVFLAAGANKQTALSQIFAPEADALAYPSRLIQPLGELVWYLDAAAAEGLPTSPLH